MDEAAKAKVSILVLMDVGLRLYIDSDNWYGYYSFNPCFNGCRSAMSRKLIQVLLMSGVSILVLMDVGLRLLSIVSAKSSPLCFNPCFNGCRSAIFSLNFSPPNT